MEYNSNCKGMTVPLDPFKLSLAKAWAKGQMFMLLELIYFAMRVFTIERMGILRYTLLKLAANTGQL